MKTPASRIKLLQDTAFFGGINKEVVSAIIESAPTVEIDEGQSFFLENDSAKAMYIIEEGQVAVIKKWKGKDYLLRKLGAGDCFGEMALMDFKPRSAAVFALEPCVAIKSPP